MRKFSFRCIMVLDPFFEGLLGSLIGTLIVSFLLWRFRFRIVLSSIKIAAHVMRDAPAEVKASFQDLVLSPFVVWEEKKDEKGEAIRVYKPTVFLQAFIAAVAPYTVDVAWRAFAGKLKNLPFGVDANGNPKLAMLQPVMAKMIDGKKITFDDFMPALMEKVLPVIEGIANKVGGMFSGPAAPPAAAAAPAGVPVAQLYNPGQGGVSK